MAQDNGQGDIGHRTWVEQEIELGPPSQAGDGTDNDREFPLQRTRMISEMNDVFLSDEELRLHSGAAAFSSNESDRCDQSDGCDANPVCSPDSYHLREAKRNLKQAEELGYNSGITGVYKFSYFSREFTLFKVVYRGGGVGRIGTPLPPSPILQLEFSPPTHRIIFFKLNNHLWLITYSE